MSESLPNQAPTNSKTIIFMVVLSFVCALILSILASILEEPKEVAKELDRSKQMMIAAKILDYQGGFLVQNKEGKYVPAKYEEGKLIPTQTFEVASKSQLLDIYSKRFEPLLKQKSIMITT